METPVWQHRKTCVSIRKQTFTAFFVFVFTLKIMRRGNFTAFVCLLIDWLIDWNKNLYRVRKWHLVTFLINQDLHTYIWSFIFHKQNTMMVTLKITSHIIMGRHALCIKENNKHNNTRANDAANKDWMKTNNDSLLFCIRHCRNKCTVCVYPTQSVCLCVHHDIYVQHVTLKTGVMAAGNSLFFSITEINLNYIVKYSDETLHYDHLSNNLWNLL